MTSCAERLGTYIEKFTFEDIPPDVIRHAKHCLLDALGVGLSGTDKPWCQAVLGLVRRHGGKPEATVWLYGDKVPDVNAALANAIFVHSMDFNDDIAGIQVGGVVPPTALAIAESIHASGKDLITAVVLGYDIATRIATAMNSQGLYMRGLQPTAVCGAFVAAAVAGKLLKLDAKTMANAFGIAGSYAGGTIEFLKEGTDTKRFHVAKAAQGGILSAHLAQLGMTGPNTIFEGEFGVFRAYSDNADPARLFEELGTRFDIMQTSFKLYPFCDGDAAPLEAALAIVRENRVALDDIERIHFRIKSFLIPYTVDYHGDKTRKYRPENELDAQMSLPYCVAVGLLRNGKLTLDDFRPERFADPEIHKLSDRMSAEGDTELDKIPLLPMSMPAIATLTTKGGKTFEKRVDYQKGDPRNPFSAEDFQRKFEACAQNVLSRTKRQQVVDQLAELERLNDVSRLTASLVKAA